MASQAPAGFETESPNWEIERSLNTDTIDPGSVDIRLVYPFIGMRTVTR